MNSSSLTNVGFLRLPQILGDPQKGVLPLIPVSKTTWYAGIQEGKFPKPVKMGRVSLWRVEDILNLMASLGEEPSCSEVKHVHAYITE